MELISRRRISIVLAGSGVVMMTLALAAPADAFPANSWWYGELSVAKVQQVNKGAGVTVALLDSGAQASLGDLAGQVLPGRSFTDGGDPRTDLADPSATYFGHGTAMAGFIAGTGRGAGMVGLAPAAKILPLRVSTSSDEGDLGAVARAIPWAADHGAKVINISLGSPAPCSPTMQSAVDYAVRHDVVIVAATGNTPGNVISSPANCVGVLAVGGLADSAAFRGWSGGTTGPELDFVAPAENLRDLLLTNVVSQTTSSGTSPAAALVSGTFALLRSRFPKDSARQIVTRALYHVHNGLPGDVFAKRIDDTLGYGEILPYNALTESVPSGASNPIYDAVDKHLAAASPSSTPSGAATASHAAPGASDDSTSGGGLSSAAVALIVVGGLIVVAAVVVFATRSRRRRPAGHPYGGPYGPPPGPPGRP